MLNRWLIIWNKGAAMDNHLEIFELETGGVLDLVSTLTCGQAFRWVKAEIPGFPELSVCFKGVIADFGVILAQRERRGSPLYVAYDPPYGHEKDVKAQVFKYLSLGDDLENINEKLLATGGVMAEAAPFSSGMRILNQDPWECIVSYLISANNSISNISRVVSNLCEAYGKLCGLGQKTFPTPKALQTCSSEDIRQSKCGYRDEYILDAAKKVYSGEIDLLAIGGMPTDLARAELVKIKGVGPKVADCILLFGYHRLSVFPVDTWVAKAVSHFYLEGKPVTPKVAGAFGRDKFGDFAGYAQEYLFHYARTFLAGGRQTDAQDCPYDQDHAKDL